MLYPLKFRSVYKDYVWGGRNLERLGKELPGGIIAESWEVSCHVNGPSIVANGEYEGILLPELVDKLGKNLTGSSIEQRQANEFPLMVKLIDADKNLSVQVHPDDNFARKNEGYKYGKDEMWYILSAEPGASLVYGLIPGTTQKAFSEAVKNGSLVNYLNTIEVSAGDTIFIPSGTVHAIGRGIMLAEVQQNSDLTYRIYDYGRTNRQLHIEKALQVTDVNSDFGNVSRKGLDIKLAGASTKKVISACRNFAAEVYDIKGMVNEEADGSRFCIYTFFEGSGVINYPTSRIMVRSGESVFIPAAMGEYSITGELKCLKSYVPDIYFDIIEPLINYGYEFREIENNISGLVLRAFANAS